MFAFIGFAFGACAALLAYTGIIPDSLHEYRVWRTNRRVKFATRRYVNASNNS